MVEELVLSQLLGRLREGRVTVRFWNGDVRSYGTSGPAVQVQLKSPAVLRRAVRSASLAVGEGYTSGEVEIDDLEAFFWLVSHNRALPGALRHLRHLYRPQANRRHRQRSQISQHYDVGNDYYRLWLDPTLTYSCAYFESAEDTLEQAQRQKIDHLLRKLRLQPGQRMLDIGSGWGHLAVSAAQQYDLSVLGVTLSSEQLDAAQKLAADEGVADRVEFRLANYQDLPESTDPALSGPFDRIISVGMFEHVGRDLHDNFFAATRQLLDDDGVAVLHTITNQVLKSNDAWIDRHIFPGGFLPTVDEVEHLLSAHGFWSVDRENLWHHYARTLALWRVNHQAHREAIVEMFDKEFYRMRDFWLAGSQVGFAHGDLGLAQFVFTKHKPRDWPWTRRELYLDAPAGRSAWVS